MRSKFCQTGNVARLTAGMSALMNRPSGVPCLAVVHGPAGRGKTEATQWYSVNKGARYLVANAQWRPLWMLCDIYAALKGIKRAEFGRTQAAWDACMRLAGADSLPVIIDEADRIVRKPALIETIRDLSDRTGTPVVFCGTDEVLFRLQQREVFASRIGEIVTFAALTSEEAQMLATELCGLRLSDEGAARLVAATDGYIRDCVVALAHLERAAKANNLAEPPAELVSDVARKVLLRRAA